MSERVRVSLWDGALPAMTWDRVEGAGASVAFEGVVRRVEEGRDLAALVYEVYEPMTSALLHELGVSVCEAHDVLRVEVVHSMGEVAVGEASFRLRVAAAHRKPALAAMDEFIDRMKRDVPIWKMPRWAEVGDG